MLKVTTLFSFLTRSVVEIPYLDDHEKIDCGTIVVIDNDMGEEAGKFLRTNESSMNESRVNLNAKLLRVASKKDLDTLKKQEEKERDLLQLLYKKVEKLSLELLPVSATLPLTEDLVYFTFRAEDRVDFRELVKELSSELKKKVLLYQIGPRDKAKMMGGYGKCGQKQCCTRFLIYLPSVTMDAARDQGIAHKGAEGLVGQCGKLMCCLNYESAEYKRLKSKFPKFGVVVNLSDGRRATVVGFDFLNEKIKVRFSEHETEVISLEDITNSSVK